MIIVCIKVGQKYGPEYVNRLAAMVARHTTKPHRFLCLTDDPQGVTCETAPVDTDLPGWWAKLVLFRPHWALACKRVLFLDLDTVIVGNMDFMLEYNGPFAILQDFYRAEGYGSAIMSIAPDFGQDIWQDFTPAVMQECWGDQNWIERRVPIAQCWQKLYPGKIVSYKVHCQERGLPADAAVVCFHGEPRPHEVSNPWMLQNWTEQAYCATP